MSEENQGALGAVVAQFAADMPALTSGLVVMTHSRHLVRAVLALSPTCIRMGDDLRPTRGWVSAEPVPATVEAFLGLTKAGHERMLAIKAVLDERQRQRRAEEGSKPRR